MKIAIVENFGLDFYKARTRLSIFLINQGWEVTAIIPDDGYVEKIEKIGIKVITVQKDIRTGLFLNKIQFAIKLYKVLKHHKFDIIHLFRLQPNIIGTPIAYIANKDSKTINHITGLGSAFSSNSTKNTISSFIIKVSYKLNLRFFKPFVIFQNPDDVKDLKLEQYEHKSIVLGSSVNESIFFEDKRENSTLNIKDLDQFAHIKYRFLFVSRLLKEKGIAELIDGFKKVKNKEKCCLVIVGWEDSNNNNSLSNLDLNKLISNEPNIKFLGQRNDVNDLIRFCNISILPSYYREGIPRFLLESLAIGRAIITTDMPGCKEVVSDKVNGLLILPKDSNEISKAMNNIQKLDLISLNKASLELYDLKFSEAKVFNSLLQIYSKLHFNH